MSEFVAARSEERGTRRAAVSELVAVQQLWVREMKQMLRRPSRILGFMMQPLMWLFIFGFGVGKGLGVTMTAPDGTSVPYILYILPGILGMKILYSGSRAGISVLRDRQGGFLKEVFVAPVRRMSILAGVTSGQVSRTLIQGILLIGAGFLLGLRISPLQLLLLLLVMALIGAGLVMLGVAMAWYSDDPATFATASNLVIFPLFLLSGALFDVSKLPSWFAVLIKLNPLTYGVDALRQIALGEQWATFPLYLDIAVILAYVLIGLSAGSVLLRRAAEES